MQGVYTIENINNGRVYIGSSKDIEKRWKEHQRNLKDNCHHSIKLQRAYNKLKDKSTLQYSVVEIVEDLTILFDREQYWTDYYDAYKHGYNCTEKVNNPKYALKNKRKMKNKADAKIEYERFSASDKHTGFIELGKRMLEHINKEDYNYYLIKRINDSIEWAYNNCDQNKVRCRIYVVANIVYVSMYEINGMGLVCTKSNSKFIYEPNMTESEWKRDGQLNNTETITQQND